jgi:trans-aconitate methyltransferase
MIDKIDIEEIKKFYDHETLRKLHGFIHTNIRIEYAWKSLNGIVNTIHPKNILEIGSGIGEICYRLASKLQDTQVFGFDISEKSIELANKLFNKPNLSFIRHDSINDVKFKNDIKFDIIFLMDVYEHIAVNSRVELHSFIRQNLSENGYIFLSCPTPQNLTYLKNNIPSEIQPIDENISFKELLDFSMQTSLRLISYKEISVWRGSDYFHAVFSNHLKMQPFSDFKFENDIESIGVKKELFKKVKTKYFNKNLSEKTNSVIIRKDLIRQKLGEEFLSQVESYKR